MIQISTVHSTLAAFILPYADHFRKRGWVVDCAAADGPAREVCKLHFDTCHIIRWSRNPIAIGNFFRGMAKIREIVVAGNYNLVHVHTPIASFITRYALRKIRKEKNIAVIYTAHGFHFHPQGKWHYNLIFRLLEKMAGKWTDALITINKTDYNAAITGEFLPKIRIKHTPGIGLDLDYYSDTNRESDRNTIRTELKLTDEFCYVVIGAIDRRKRVSDVIEAFSKTNHSNSKLIIVGIGQLKSVCKELVTKLDLEDDVIFLGGRNDVNRILNATDCLVAASSQEGLPRCVMEALAQGVPVIGSNIRGTRDLIENGSGLIFDVADTDKLAALMKEIRTNKDIYESCKAEGLRRIGNYNIDLLLASHEEIYNEALQSLKGHA